MSAEMSVLLLWLVLVREGAAIRPAVTFTPDYKKIFTSEQITMTCDVGSTIGERMDYIWYKDSEQVYNGQSYIIQYAKTSHSGSYQCQSRPGEISDPARLEVSHGWVILQTPLYVYEGDDIYIRCHHYPGYRGGWTRFYKDNRIIRDSSDNGEYYISNVTRTAAGIYTCTKEVYHDGLYYKHGDDVSVSVQDLFTTPTISVTPQPVITTDKLSLTCQTSLPPPPRHNTQLWIAFYREGGIVQGFEVSDTYEVYNVQLEDSGKYSCEVETTDGRVRKRSAETIIQIGEFFSYLSINVMDELFGGNPMTLTCDTTLSPYRPTTRLQFAFYRDGRKVQDSSPSNKYEVQSAQLEDSGNYTCEVETTDGRVRKRSAETIIQIEDLISHPYIIGTNNLGFEGDPMTLTCDATLNSKIKPREVQFSFYRDGQKLQEFSPSNTYEVQSAQLEDSGNYTCYVRTLKNPTMKKSNESYILVTELFSPPVLKVSPELVKDGDNITLTCGTNLTEHRLKSAKLQYVFYRDGRNIQGFSSDNKYEVQFIQEEHSGNYSCEIQTPNSKIKKRSQNLHVQGSSDSSLMTILYVSLGLLLLIIITLVVLCIYYECRSPRNNPQPPTADENEYTPEDEVHGTILEVTSRPQNYESEDNEPTVIYAAVNSKKKRQVKASQTTSESPTDVYQNVRYHR
ncbi:Fc receptor-like protein 5 [Leptodactylus fuscus]|uniref:Fc receptor-like protein 5 n=1 Tax=Leptodactylus fuscus TaxID=238119 RepID=UPI003F4F1498